MYIGADCTGTRKYVRVTDPTDQRTWEVWCEPGSARWASQPESPDSPEAWVVQDPNGAKYWIDIDMVGLTIEVLFGRLSGLLGGEDTARQVLELFEPLRLDSEGCIIPDVYVPSPCR